MPRVVHFEIQAAEPERLAAFYREVFGWRLQRWEGPVEYWLIRTGESAEPGIDGGLLRRRGASPDDAQPVNAFVCTVDVPDLDAVLTRLPEAGGSVALAKMAIPGVGWLAYVKDPDGNILGALQADPTAD